MMTKDLISLYKETSALLLEWARRLEKYYAHTGSMDLDLQYFPDAKGPSYYNQFAHYAYLLLSEKIVL